MAIPFRMPGWPVPGMVQLLWYNLDMKEIPATKFKATCLAVLAEVERTRKPVRVTRFGKAVVEITPARNVRKRKSWIGCMRGQMEIVGDIVGPIGAFDNWKVEP